MNITGRHGVPGVNTSGERLIEMCLERELMIANSMFKKKDICKYTWTRVGEGQVVDRPVMYYVLVSKYVCGRLLDVNVYRGESGVCQINF